MRPELFSRVAPVRHSSQSEGGCDALQCRTRHRPFLGGMLTSSILGAGQIPPPRTDRPAALSMSCSNSLLDLVFSAGFGLFAGFGGGGGA